MKKPDQMKDILWRYRGVLLVLLVPLGLVALVLTLLPRTASARDPTSTIQELRNHDSGLRYAVVFDAGSTGSRVHVFKFTLDNGHLILQSDTFEQLKPGLSSYADSSDDAAVSLQPLIETAIKTVPKALQASTPVSLKATAGLRLLPGDKADKILKAVTATLKALPFKLAPDAVGIMDGKDEGAYAWLTLNYLLGKLGGSPEATISAIDLGGGSVQEAFAMTADQARAAPKDMVTTLSGGGKTYHVYVHSYLGYGLMAARAKVLEISQGAAEGHPCYAKGAETVYKYAGKDYIIKPSDAQADHKKCSTISIAAMAVQMTCNAPQTECTFNGVWRGLRPKEAAYYVSSYFWDRAFDSGIIKDERAIVWSTNPSEFASMAMDVCSKAHDIQALTTAYPRVKAEHAPFLCADLSYCAQLMVAGFKLAPQAHITLVKQIEYKGQNIEAAWPLGAAVNDLSQLSSVP